MNIYHTFTIHLPYIYDTFTIHLARYQEPHRHPLTKECHPKGVRTSRRDTNFGPQGSSLGSSVRSDSFEVCQPVERGSETPADGAPEKNLGENSVEFLRWNIARIAGVGREGCFRNFQGKQQTETYGNSDGNASKHQEIINKHLCPILEKNEVNSCVRFHLHGTHSLLDKRWITHLLKLNLCGNRNILPHQTIDVGDTILRGKKGEAVCRFIWVRRHVIFEERKNKQAIPCIFPPNMVSTIIYGHWIASEHDFSWSMDFWIYVFYYFPTFSDHFLKTFPLKNTFCHPALRSHCLSAPPVQLFTVLHSGRKITCQRKIHEEEPSHYAGFIR